MIDFVLNIEGYIGKIDQDDCVGLSFDRDD